MKLYIRSSQNSSTRERLNVAKKSTDSKELSTLAHDIARSVRLAVLKNKNTSQAAIEGLCNEFVNDTDDDVRELVARRTNNINLLEQLATDKCCTVKWSVAENTACPASVLDKLFEIENDKDPDWVDITLVRNIGKNPNCSKELMLKLIECGGLAATAVASNPKFPKKMIDSFADGDDEMRKACACRCTDFDILMKLTQDNEYRVREALTYNPNLPEEIAMILVDDPDSWIRGCLAEETKYISVLRELSKDSDAEVRAYAKSNLAKLDKTDVTDTDWSIPLNSVTKYSQIAKDLTEVIRKAMQIHAERHGTTSTVTTPNKYVYDRNYQLPVTVGERDYGLWINDILPYATCSNNKSECINALVDWLEKRNFGVHKL